MSDSEWGAKILPLLPEGIIATHLGGGYFQLDFPRIAQTGGNKISNYVVPFPHQLLTMFIKHTTDTLADATTVLTFELKQIIADNLLFTLSKFTSAQADEKFFFQHQEGVSKPMNYQFHTNSTLNHWVYISMVVRALGAP